MMEKRAWRQLKVAIQVKMAIIISPSQKNVLGLINRQAAVKMITAINTASVFLGILGRLGRKSDKLLGLFIFAPFLVENKQSI